VNGGREMAVQASSKAKQLLMAVVTNDQGRRSE
jgi:hypothetical protein